MFGSMPTPQRTSLVGADLDVGDGRGLLARAQGMLGVVEHLHLHAEVPAEGVDQGRDRAVAVAGDGARAPTPISGRRERRRRPSSDEVS